MNTLTNKTFRLPTDIEWEYAARGGKYSEKIQNTAEVMISMKLPGILKIIKKSKYGDKGTTHPVGMKKPNELGLYDMSGNVWEWCDNWYTQEYSQNGKSVHPGWPFNGTSAFFRRVLRGGSWGGTAKGCRVSYIDYDVPTIVMNMEVLGLF